jgi:hypothetical protein
MHIATLKLGIMLIIAIRTALLNINIVSNMAFFMLLFGYYVRSTHFWSLTIDLKCKLAVDGTRVCARSIFTIRTAEC